MAPTSRAVAALLLCCAYVANAQRLAVTIRPGTTPTGPTAAVMGINTGHTWDASAWLYMRRLGVNAARVFGGTGGVRPSRARSTGFGKSISGAPVTNYATYLAAIAELRTFDGHAIPGTSTNAPKWATYTQALSAVDFTDPSGTSLLDKVKMLWQNKMEPMVVQWATCTAFSFTTYIEAEPAYWAERWELYLHQYTLSVLAWMNDIRKVEFWNEPDLHAECIDFEVHGGTRWVHYYLIQTQAINDAFADLNAEVASGKRPCQSVYLSCPMQPVIYASAFASATFGGPTGTTGAYLGQPTVAWEHGVFGPHPFRNNTSVQNMHAYSVHTYGKTGQQFTSLLGALDRQIFALHTPNTNPPPGGKIYATLPVAITEHMTHTSGSWNAMKSHADFGFEASRTAAQSMRAALGNYEPYIFKFSSEASRAGGIVKAGVHWGDNTVFPFAVGDTTLSAEAARLIATYVGLNKSSFSFVVSPTSSPSTAPPNNFRTVAVTNDNVLSRRFITYVNDCQGNDGEPAQCHPTTGNAVDVALTLDLKAWSLPAGTLVPIILVTDGYYGDVVALPAVTAGGNVTAFSPANSVLVAIAPLLPAGGRQVVTNVPVQALTLQAGSQRATGEYPHTSVWVGTSNTANHDSTFAALLSVAVPTIPNPTAMILEFTVASPPHTLMVLNIFAQACDSWDGTTPQSWNSATFAINASVPTNAVISSPNQNFAAIYPWTRVAGHVSVFPAGTAGAASVVRVQVTDAALACAGKRATFLVHRRFRHPRYTGNASGDIVGDELSGGASTQLSNITLKVLSF